MRPTQPTKRFPILADESLFLFSRPAFYLFFQSNRFERGREVFDKNTFNRTTRKCIALFEDSLLMLSNTLLQQACYPRVIGTIGTSQYVYRILFHKRRIILEPVFLPESW